ncbi:major facilitator superfamily transporter [Pseudomassariella vexata]|uniref:Major facilitator superfamily transporter n=1 Tax=Pseudomassariella vexata TaxID=1141098 RepID=A0A1Y2D8B6_9PEZI|nr:major facilitator superfamily transporter [Pseudomassariella vexata]ORY55503.1 major facilitator superfamily transporter [Pseudomassariella vexata]
MKEKEDRQRTPADTAVPTAEEEAKHLHGFPLFLLILGLDLVIFLISIDRTIITTAIPFITGEFHSTADIGWYGSAYLMIACGFMPVFGRAFTLFTVKWAYIFCLFMFGLGSLICALAPNSNTLIVGRAVAGFGSAGTIPGSFVVVAEAVPLHTRPIFTAIVGLMFGVGATCGPVLGGVFTDLVNWRWCFWINLPILSLPLTVMLLVFRGRPRQHRDRSVLDRLVSIDFVGSFVLLGAITMLFLALEDTASGADWGSPKVIGLLCAFGVTSGLFFVWQWWKQDGALIPPHIITQRTVAASCLQAFFSYSILVIHAYFLPIWFQAILGETAIMSGVDMIPYVVANALMSLVAGAFVSKVGYFTPPAIVGGAIGTVGCGILTLLHPGISTREWIGYEILVSAGFGLSIQMSFSSVQTVLHPEDIGIGTAAVVAMQSLGGAIFVSVGNSVLLSRIRDISVGEGPSAIPVGPIIQAGATAFRDMVPPSQLPFVLDVINKALTTVFMLAVPLGGLATIAACFMEWKSVRGRVPV